MKEGYNKEKSKERLREIFKESGMQQGEFGRKILEIPEYNDPNYPDSYTSSILNGKNELSIKKAKTIVKHYPALRAKWLLGMDDYKTETQRMFGEFMQFSTEVEFRGFAFRILAELSGFDIFLEISKDSEKAIEAVKKGYTIQKGAQLLGHISLKQFNLLSKDIQELTEQRIRSFLRESEA